MKLGIDFGTCFSFPATVRGQMPESLLKNGQEHPDGIPSVFYYDSNTGEKVGLEADLYRGAHPSYGVEQIKKKIRSGEPVSNITYKLDDRVFSAKEIIVKIIKYIIEVAKEVASDIPITPLEIENIAIAVPSLSGSNTYRQIILEIVCEASGLPRESVSIIDEPVAAALSYFSTRKNISNGTTVLTYDLGGGTFDTAIVRYNALNPQRFTTLIQSGNTNVGGTNWDDELRAYFIRENNIQIQGSVVEAQFKKKVIEIKHSLSLSEKYRNSFLPEDGESSYILTITRQQFEQMTKPLLDLTINVVKDVIMRYKEKTGENESNISTIVMVGGASKMPQVINRLKQEFPGKEILLDKPERAIAFGAAMYAATDWLISTAPHTYGIDCHNRDNDNTNQINNILFRDTEMEVHDNGKYITARKSYVPYTETQTAIGFNVYETDDPKGKDWTPFNGRKPMFYISVPITPIDGIETKKRSFAAEFKLLQDGILELHVYDKDQGGKEVGFDKTSIY